jgi:hypothetical protein
VKNWHWQHILKCRHSCGEVEYTMVVIKHTNKNIVHFWVVLARFCPIVVQVTPLKTLLGLLILLLQLQSHLATITHNYFLRRYACTQLTILRQCFLLDVFTPWRLVYNSLRTLFTKLSSAATSRSLAVNSLQKLLRYSCNGGDITLAQTAQKTVSFPYCCKQVLTVSFLSNQLRYSHSAVSLALIVA